MGTREGKKPQSNDGGCCGGGGDGGDGGDGGGDGGSGGGGGSGGSGGGGGSGGSGGSGGVTIKLDPCLSGTLLESKDSGKSSRTAVVVDLAKHRHNTVKSGTPDLGNIMQHFIAEVNSISTILSKLGIWHMAGKPSPQRT